MHITTPDFLDQATPDEAIAAARQDTNQLIEALGLDTSPPASTVAQRLNYTPIYTTDDRRGVLKTSPEKARAIVVQKDPRRKSKSARSVSESLEIYFYLAYALLEDSNFTFVNSDVHHNPHLNPKTPREVYASEFGRAMLLDEPGLRDWINVLSINYGRGEGPLLALAIAESLRLPSKFVQSRMAAYNIDVYAL